MPQILNITQDTVLKRRPLQTTELGADEVFPVQKDAKYELQSYAYADANGDDYDDHIKIALKNDAPRGFNTWYVYELHSQVLQDNVVVYPRDEEADSPQHAKITQDTIFKRRPLPAAQLKPEEVASVPAGKIFEVQSYASAADGEDFNDHVKIALGDTNDYIRGMNTWYVYEQHIKIFLDDDLVYPLPEDLQPASSGGAAAPSGPYIMLPGNASKFYLNQPIVPGSFFTWGDATKNGKRIPKTTKIVSNIIALTKALEKPRQQIGKPFIITSWYRPPEVNRNVPGAASNSQHQYGKAIDFKVPGVSPRQVAKELAWWPGGMGTYPSWNHLDIGPKRRW